MGIMIGNPQLCLRKGFIEKVSGAPKGKALETASSQIRIFPKGLIFQILLIRMQVVRALFLALMACE